MFIGLYSYSQDTINFKLYDSLKTKTEDGYRHFSTKPKSNKSFPSDSTTSLNYDINDTITVKSERKYHYFPGVKIIYEQDPDNFDVRLFRSINNSRSPLKTKILNTTDNSMLPVSILVPPALMVYGRVRQKTYDENTGYLLFTSELTSVALTFGTKLLVNRQRPLNALRNVYSKGSPILDVYSFPSGHTSSSFALATMFTLRYPKYPQVYAPMFIWSLMVAYGRPYFGMHYPSDLLAGAIIGSGSSILIYSLRKELFKFKNQVLGEDKNDDGSINAGVLTFFGAAFAISAVFDNFIFREDPGKRFFISPWMDSKRGGLNVKWKL